MITVTMEREETMPITTDAAIATPEPESTQQQPVQPSFMMAQRSRVPKKFRMAERRTRRFQLARPGGAKGQDMTILNYRQNPADCGVVDMLAGKCDNGAATGGPDADVLTITLITPFYSTAEMESDRTYMHVLKEHLEARNAALMEQVPDETRPTLYELVGLRGLKDEELKEVLAIPNAEFIGHKAPFVKTTALMGPDFKLSPSLLAPPMEGFSGQKSARYARKSELVEIYADWVANGFAPLTDDQIQAALLRGGGRANRKAVMVRRRAIAPPAAATAATAATAAPPAAAAPLHLDLKCIASMAVEVPASPTRSVGNVLGNDNLEDID